MGLLADISSSIGDFLSPIGNMFGSILNFGSQQTANRNNWDINERNLDYNAALTRESWERDDTAHQREVKDLQAAGLSPLANTTGSQVTSPLSAPNPIAMQAPQIDINSVINSALRSKELDETKRHNQEVEGHEETKLIYQAEEITQKADELEIENKKVEGQIKYQADLIKNEADALQEAKEHNDEEEYLRRVEYESEQYWKEIKQQVPGDYSYQDIYDINIYRVRIKLWNTQFEHFLDSIGATQSATASSKSSSAAGGGNLGITTVPGSPGVSVGANGSNTDSESNYEMENLSEKQKQMLINFYNKHPKPVYHMKKWEFKK